MLKTFSDFFLQSFEKFQKQSDLAFSFSVYPVSGSFVRANILIYS